ncbi:hypothetical protein L7F22_014131 [Adiantum nelumboides]|nr:hypothetical protein [Adiantum nelumboides]
MEKMDERLFATIKGKQIAGMQEGELDSMMHTRSMKMAMEELFQARQQEEPVEVESNEAESESYQGSGEIVGATFDPNEEETQVWLKRIGLYEFACLPWDAWVENEFAEQQWNMIKEGKGVITGDVRLTPKLVSKKTAYMSNEAFAPLYQAQRGVKVDWPTVLYDWIQLTGKRDRHQTPVVGRMAPYLAAIFEHVLKVTLAALGLKTLAADTLMEEGTTSGSKRWKLLLGSPTIDIKSPFKVYWKDLEEPELKLNFFSMGSKFKKSESKGSSASHGTMGIFFVKEATNCLTADLSKFLQSQDEALREKSDKEKLQEEVTRLTAEAKSMTTEILSVAEDFQQWVNGLKTAVDEQFKKLDEKVAAVTTENVLLINRLSPLAEMEKAVLQGQGMIGVLESVKRENDALKIENESLVAEMEEMRNNRKEIEDSLSKLKAELSSGLLEPDWNLAMEVESDVEKQADADFVAEKAMEIDVEGDTGEQTT